jgi:beta-1,4-N-acetylgalactosaminyltransferase 2
MNIVEEKVTALIKTFERPGCTRRLFKSIKKYYPEMKVIIADDSKKPKPIQRAYKYLEMPFDTGLSAGRNEMIRNVDTEYFFLLDDDWIFDEDTKLEILVDILESTDVDLIASKLKRSTHYYGTLKRQGHKLFMKTIKKRKGERYCVCDYTHNCILSRVSTFKEKKLHWDAELKLNEHLEFFIRNLGKMKVAYTDDVAIDHRPMRNNNYNPYRIRNFFKIGMKKNGIKEFHNFAGKVYNY